MPTTPTSSDQFIGELTEIIQQNMGDERFGVSELAEKVHMSRSNLLRKIQKSTGLTASVFIRNVRLTEAQRLLWKKELTVSEVSYQVGFNSVSYFVKCYRELFGYPPGEEEQPQEAPSAKEITRLKRPAWKWPAVAILLLALVTLVFQLIDTKAPVSEEKSILVLPFQNDSADSTNVYLVNGLMEAILNNLQKVEDLRVLSRTTSEFYRNSGKTIQEIAEELDVVYFIEGSGQKQGEQILLTVQLIRGETDDHLWSEQYLRQASDIFSLQAEVAKDIANEVEAKLQPDEIKRIEKVLTKNIVAYDHYLKGLEAINQETFEGIETGIKEFKKAIEEDSTFAEPYAYITIGYFYDDMFKGKKAHSENMAWYANKAYDLAPNSSLILTAKGLNAMHQTEYDSAIYYLESVIEINPNSGRAYNTLSDIHLNYIYNPKKYLQYALKAMQIDLGAQDSTTLSYTYLHLSNALVQTGFLNLSEEFIERSMAMDSSNLFSIYVHAYIEFAQDGDFKKAERQIYRAYLKDTNRVDIIQELAKINYNERNFERAAYFYDKMNNIKAALSLNLYEEENVKVAYSLEKIGKTAEARKYYERYKAFAEQDTSYYGHLSLAAYKATQGNIEEGIFHLNQFSEARSIPYWFILFLEDDPILNEMAEHPDFRSIIQKITDNFWAEHEKIRQELTNTEIDIR